MYKHILISTDGSEVAQKGLDHGLSLAKEIGAKVSVITVTESFPVYASAGAGVGAGWVPIEMADYDKVQDEFANRVFAGAKQAAEQHGVAVETIHVRNAQPAEAMVNMAMPHRITGLRPKLSDSAPWNRFMKANPNR